MILSIVSYQPRRCVHQCTVQLHSTSVQPTYIWLALHQPIFTTHISNQFCVDGVFLSVRTYEITNNIVVRRHRRQRPKLVCGKSVHNVCLCNRVRSLTPPGDSDPQPLISKTNTLLLSQEALVVSCFASNITNIIYSLHTLTTNSKPTNYF